MQRLDWILFPGFVAQTGLRLASPLPQTDLSHDNSFEYAKRSEAVEDRGADLDPGNLALEVLRREALTEQFHTVHFCLNAASAVVSGQLSPKCSPQIS